MIQNTMKSPLIENEFVENELNNEGVNLKYMSLREKQQRFARNSSKNSTATQTSNADTNLLMSPLSMHNNSLLNGTPSAILCRICYTADGKEPLLQPCDCSGTMGLMHKSCLEKWLSQCNKNHCEICNFEFDIKRKARSFGQWLFRPITTKDSKNILNDLLCFFILTPLAFLSTWYCVVFAFKFNENSNKWESSGLVVLTTCLIVIYILWLIFSLRYHFRVFKDWQKKNQIVTLNLDETRLSCILKLKNFSAKTLIENQNSNTDPQVQLTEQQPHDNSIEIVVDQQLSESLNAEPQLEAGSIKV